MSMQYYNRLHVMYSNPNIFLCIFFCFWSAIAIIFESQIYNHWLSY